MTRPNTAPGETTVLVVGDSSPQRARLRFLLEEAGYTVLTADDGRQGLDAARAHRIDLIISDIVMPEFDGYGMCRALRADLGLRHLPVILLSSLSDPQDVIRALEAGANNFICKPYEDASLLARVNNALDAVALHRTSTSEKGSSIFFAGQRYFITADRLQILELLLSTYENAITRNTELTRARNELRELNQQLEQRVAERTAELAERVRELRCLYAISTLVAEPHPTIAETLRAAVDLIPSGWTYPENTCARIVFEEQTFATASYGDSPWKQSTDLVVAGEVLGSVEVGYLAERPARDEGPFLHEERELITDIGRQLSVMIQRERATAGLRDSQQQLRRHVRELDARHRIAEIFLTVPDEQMFARVLDVVLEVLQSPYGVFGYLDEEGGLVVPTMTREIWADCQVEAKTHFFPRSTWGGSAWATALREQRTILCNEPSTNTPAGHIAIKRHTALPLVHQGRVIGLLNVANKETDYTPVDLALLARIGEMLAPVLDARLGRERAAAAQQSAERDLAERLAELERWHDVMLGREYRVLELKREVNALCRRGGEPARYASTDTDEAGEP